jgi:hypothetical protein
VRRNRKSKSFPGLVAGLNPSASTEIAKTLGIRFRNSNRPLSSVVTACWVTGVESPDRVTVATVRSLSRLPKRCPEGKPSGQSQASVIQSGPKL